MYKFWKIILTCIYKLLLSLIIDLVSLWKETDSTFKNKKDWDSIESKFQILRLNYTEQISKYVQHTLNKLCYLINSKILQLN